jgi:hypothetical protein
MFNLSNINLSNINITTFHIKYFIIFLLCFCVVSFVLFIFCSYIIFKFIEFNFDNNNLLFYQYNKKSQKILDLYGEHKLTKIYLVRQPLGKFVTFLFNMLTFYNYDTLINEKQHNLPYHTLLVFQIKLQNGIKKMLLLEKNNCINICENFVVNKFEIKELNIKNKNFTINSILKSTQQRLGNKKYFNWNLYTNNCQEFTKEILKTIKKYNKTNKKFILRNKILKIINPNKFPTEFTYHILNCLCLIFNITNKYIYDYL